jgi:oligosaccharide reducing-end xylanase
MSHNNSSASGSPAPRWRSVVPLSAGLGMLLSVTGCQAGEPAAPLADGHGAYATGKYRNLFAEAGHSQKEIRQKIDSAFQQLFHGSPETQTVFYWAGTNANGPLAFITDIKHEDVRTEGLSYGMMIAVQLDRKADFDALWNWSKTFLYHDNPKHPSYGFFSWQARTNGDVMSEFVAPDGEEYYVTALYFAAHRWGNGKGIYNYKAEADRLLTDMRHRRSIKGDLKMGRHETVTDVVAGPLFDEEHKMVLFTPSSERPRFTDPSYHLPAFYELWARWGPEADRSFWAGAAAASRNYLPRAAHPVTSLTPDYSEFDGTPVSTPWHENAFSFGYDAFRTAGNWSVDWSWWAKEPRERVLSDNLQAFFKSKGMANYGCRFSLDGKEQLDARHAEGLAAVNAVASLAATQPVAKEFVEALWNSPVPDGLERYYEGLLYMMGLLHCGGEFKVWMPK